MMGYISDGAVRTFNRWMLGMPQPRRNTTRTFTWTLEIDTTDLRPDALEHLEAKARRELHHGFDAGHVRLVPTPTYHQH